MTMGRTRRSAGGHGTPLSAVVDGALRGFEPLGVESLDRICCGCDDPVGILVRLEVREHVVGERPRITATGPPHADAQADEIGRAELLRNRTQTVVTGEPAAAASLQPAEVE